MKFSVLFNILFCGLFILTACRQKQKQVNFEKKHQEVMLIDIPIPLGVNFLDNSKNSYTYSTKLNLAELISFYNIEMEVDGWNKLAHYSDSEVLMVFEKPNKHASISIRPQKNELNNVIIFIMH